ncbi:diguanylate cyclase [Ilumatobacter sp.]|uniref:diguanylate cyclase n=1 Tax=Ilumatobacter sp. TaxID=1967498 RepID=UPI003B51F06B
MRFFRLSALVLSLGLLVATVVSVIDRRSDMRADRSARAEVAATLASTSVRSAVSRVNQDVHLAALAAGRDGSERNSLLAADLGFFFPGADVCVGETAGQCTGADLFALPAVGELAAIADDGAEQLGSDASGAPSTIGVDADTSSLIVLRRIRPSDNSIAGWVALRLPVGELVGSETREAIESDLSRLDVVPSPAGGGDRRSEVNEVDGRYEMVETIGSPFASGSLELVTSVDAGVAIGSDQWARYGVLIALGSVLLALAGWTFLIERRQLERRATTDELTGLVNRREFERVSEEQLDIADRFSTGLCVMVIDLNGFKQVNDTLGHQFGDLVLTASSQRLVSAVRDTDVVGRWGGDEFVILLPGLIERTAVRDSAERIWSELAGSPVVGDTTMTASIGAAIFPRHGTTLDGLMRAADVAMYEAKTTGVGHRIADTIAVGEALLASSDHADSGEVVTDGYAGPDRRHSTVLPPPSSWSDRVLDPTRSDPTDVGPVDEPSAR